MSNIKMVTGNGATVNAEDDRCLNAASISSTNVVFADVGSQFDAELISNNCVRIGPGEGLLQGVHFRIPDGKYEDMTIDNGTQGQYRYDRIVVRYDLNAVTQEETITMAVIKGENAPSIDEATYPGWTGPNDKIYDGDLRIDFPLYLVKIEELSVTEIIPSFDIMCSLKNIYPVGSIYLSTNITNPGTYLGGVWEQFAVGKALIGAGELIDEEAGTRSFYEPEMVYGSDKQTLTIDNIPSHSHAIVTAANGVATGGTIIQRGYQAESAVSQINSLSTGALKPTPISVMQPSIAIFIWRRIA